MHGFAKVKAQYTDLEISIAGLTNCPEKEKLILKRNVTKQVKIVIIKDAVGLTPDLFYAAAIRGVLPLTLNSSSFGYTR